MKTSKLTKSILAVVAIAALVVGCDKADDPELKAPADTAQATHAQESVEDRLIDSKAFAQQTSIPASITTPDKVESKIGTLQFTDGYPTAETASKIRDELDYLHGVEAFLNSMRGVATFAMHKSFERAGVNDNDVLLYTELLDSQSMFLTPNADTVYYLSFLNLSKGPVIFEAPPDALGFVGDMWDRWVSDFGLPGAERGQGGKYLFVGPGYKGRLPEGGFIIRKSRTNRILVVGRSFLTNDDPAPTVAVIKKHLKIYPYSPGGDGTSIGSLLQGKVPALGALPKPASPRYVEGTGRAINTISPNDFTYYRLLDELVQSEPPEALDPETAGQFAAIGIVKGKKFSPDARMQKILEQAVAVGNAASRTLGMGAHPTERYRYYDKSAWWSMMWTTGYNFRNPPPMITKDGVKPFPNTGARTLNGRTSYFYSLMGNSPAMIMRLRGVGSTYLMANVDTDGKPFDGSKTYKVVLPKDIPAARFWSLTVYDNQSRSMLRTQQPYSRAGSQGYPSPAAAPSADGSITVYFSPKQPDGVERGNWIQTDPEKGWFTMIRLYSPLESFFDKSWRPGEVEMVN